MRSELQLALLALAAVLLLALYLNGKWQERRLLRRMRDRLHGGLGDALFDAAAVPRRQEPRFFSTTAPAGADNGRAAAAATVGAAVGSAGGAGVGSTAGSAGRHAPGSAADAGEDFAVAAPADVPYPSGGVAGEGTGQASFAIAPADVPLRPSAAPEVTSEALHTSAVLLRSDWTEDPLLDCSLEIRCARAVDGVSVIDAAAVLAHTPWQLPVHFVVWDGRTQQWVLPDRFGYYTDALASIQLVDRRARIDAAELARFVAAVRQVAAALDADVDAPDTERLLVMAQDLDRLCARFDVRIGLTVESTGPQWTGPQLRNAAQDTGFVATGAQRWLWCDPQGQALYSLQADPAQMNRLSLELDIATASAQSQAFRAMVDSAFALAATLGARVVDDNGAPIEGRSIEAIDAQLAQVYAEMRNAGIEPGSARARRLYS